MKIIYKYQILIVLLSLFVATSNYNTVYAMPGGGGGGETDCANGVDDDGDGFIDCDDTDCNGDSNCATTSAQGCPLGANNDLGSVGGGDACSNATSLGSLDAACPCDGSNVTPTEISGTTVGSTAESPYVSIPGCDPIGDDMASPANDVWYEVEVNGYNMTVDIPSSTLSEVNIGIYTGTCGSLTAIACHVGTPPTQFTTANVTIGQTVLIQVSGAEGETGDFDMVISNNQGCDLCVQDATFTADPPPTDGVYDPGTTVEFCSSIYQYEQVNTNWFHGWSMNFGSGWDMSTFSVTTTPNNCSGTNAQWLYGTYTMSDGNTYTGMFYDLGSNGDPSDNFGDNCDCTGSGCTTPLWTFCFEVTTDAVCVDGEDLTVELITWVDGQVGSWSDIACEQDFNYYNVAYSECTVPLSSDNVILSAENFGDKNLLKWMPNSEVENTSYYVIQRKTGNAGWKQINRIDKTTGVAYKMEDKGFPKGHNYYRVKQVLKSGGYHLSNEVVLHNGVKARNIVKVFNIYGQEVSDDTKGLVIEVYDDGSAERKFRPE